MFEKPPQEEAASTRHESTLKTRIDAEKVITVLHNQFSPDIDSLHTVKGGETSQAFSFLHEGKKLIIRVNTSQDGYQKDDFAFKNFSSESVPIPEVLKLGVVDENHFYAISEQAEGDTIDHLPLEKISELTPLLIATADTIHSTNIQHTQNYGRWNKDGKADFATWGEFLLSAKDEQWFEWERLYKETFMEQAVLEKTIEKMAGLIPSTSNERTLVHADYGFSNVVSDGKRITGVIDWAESLYGDPLFDVAWLDFWSDHITYKDLFQAHYRKQGKDMNNYNERIDSSKLYIGLRALGFFAKSNQKRSYEYVIKKMTPLLS